MIYTLYHSKFFSHSSHLNQHIYQYIIVILVQINLKKIHSMLRESLISFHFYSILIRKWFKCLNDLNTCHILWDTVLQFHKTKRNVIVRKIPYWMLTNLLSQYSATWYSFQWRPVPIVYTAVLHFSLLSYILTSCQTYSKVWQLLSFDLFSS